MLTFKAYRRTTYVSFHHDEIQVKQSTYYVIPYIGIQLSQIDGQTTFFIPHMGILTRLSFISPLMLRSK